MARDELWRAYSAAYRRVLGGAGMISVRRVDGKTLHFKSIRAYLAWYAEVAIYEPRGLQLLSKEVLEAMNEKARRRA